MAIKTHKVTLSLDNPRVIQSGINVQSFDKQSIQISIELTKNDEVFRVPSDATIRVSLLKLARQEQKIIVDVPNTNRDSIDWIVPDYLDGYQGTVRVGVYLVSGTENVDLGYFTILSNVSDIDKMADEFTDNVFQGWEQIEADLNELNLTIAQTKLDLAEDLTQIDNTIANINAKNTQVNTLASDFTADVATKQADVTSKYNAFDTSVTQASQTIDDILALQPQFQAVLDETTGKDVISAPEIILARGGAQTLGERLNEEKAEVTAQLAQIETQKADKTYAENTQQQVNNLVLGAVGDGNNAEVVQARGSFPILNDRLNAFDSANDLKLNNLVVNGNFKDNSAWSSVGGTLSTLNNVGLVTGDGGRNEPFIYQNAFEETNAIYYAKTKMRVTNSKATRLSISENTTILTDIINPVINQWYELSTIKHPSPSAHIRLYTFYPSSSDATNSATEIGETIVVNLTSVFGVGNEPTKEEMDELIEITGWFNGEITLTQKELANLLLGSIRDNKNELIDSYLKFKNVINNGNFGDGITGWGNGGASISVLNNVLSINGNGTTASPYILQEVFLSPEDVYYVRARVRVRNDLSNTIYLSSNAVSLVSVTNPIKDEWYTLSALKQPSDLAYLRLYTRYTDTSDALNGVTEVDGNSGIMVMNLTEIFGSGNEPSKEEMDKLVDIVGWFDGESTLKHKELARYTIDSIDEIKDELNTSSTFRTNEIIVDVNGTGDFLTIKEAVESISDSSFSNRYHIFVKNGVYNEVNIDIYHHYIDIEGESRDGVIVRADGTSGEWATVDLFDKHGFWITATSNISHLTIDVNDVKYAIHSDGRPKSGGNNYDIVVSDCHLKHRDNWVVGAGAKANQNMTYVDCTFEMVKRKHRSAGSVEGTCGMNWHNWNNQTDRARLDLIRCKFINCGIVQCGDLGSNQDDIVNVVDCTTNNLEQGIYFVYLATYWEDENGEVPNDATTMPSSIRLNLTGSVPNIEIFNYKTDRSVCHANGYYDVPVIHENNATILKGMAVSLNRTSITNMRYSGEIMSGGTRIFGVALEDIGDHQTGWVSMKDKVTFGLMKPGTYARGDLLKVTNGKFEATLNESEAVAYVLVGGTLSVEGLLKIKVGL